MTVLINSLDNIPCQIGENGHYEHGWSNDINEEICQLFFQLTRTKNENQQENIFNITLKILNKINEKFNARIMDREIFIDLMSLMYRMIGHTRDIIAGKGEYNLSYILIMAWYKFNPELAMKAFSLFVMNDKDDHPYGSWKDIKYFCQLCFEKDGYENIIDYAIKIMNYQLKLDEEKVNNGDMNISLVAKWIPREKSKFGKFYGISAMSYYSKYINTSNDKYNVIKSENKAKMEYRKLISRLNTILDTTQIKQCDRRWNEIDPHKQTSITMHKQKNAFLNLNKNGEIRSFDLDRVECSNNFSEYIKNALKGKVEIKGKRIGINDFVKNALTLSSQDKEQIDLLNLQWENNATMNTMLDKMIAMVDVSGSMSGDPMYAAVGLGIRIAEKSLLGKRVLTFSSTPTWVNLEDCDSFYEMVKKVRSASWGTNTNIYNAFEMILDAIVKSKMDPVDVQDMVLVILSDMQIDQADSKFMSLMDVIELRYKNTGLIHYGKALKPPHLVFWNLRSTNGFPALSSRKNVSMMSGFSPLLLNIFCEEGLKSLEDCTPFNMMKKTLKNERYDIMDELLINYYDKQD